ncbi:hypothetical protein OPQ81_005289 [Rhizoctonia solani]|nr:hypothetical protein OPQ81_005289 [Rhizoctonia solani]
MANPYYDEETEGMVYLIQPEEDDCDYEDWDMQTISSFSTAPTTSAITSDQLGDFFRESHGRTYPLDENLPLTYPADDIEALRHQMQHQFLKALVHERVMVAGMVQEMAVEFPHCDIVSVDIAPIVTHAPRANVKFEIYDLYPGVAEPDETFDYISCRHVQTHVKEYDRFIFDLYRVLRPGDWLRPNSPFWAQTGLKYQISSAHVQAASQGFCHIRKQVVLLPTGTWHPDPVVKQVGALITRVWTLAWRQLEPMLVEYGPTQENANKICKQAMEELSHPELQCLGKYHMVTATKAMNSGHK